MRRRTGRTTSRSFLRLAVACGVLLSLLALWGRDLAVLQLSARGTAAKRQWDLLAASRWLGVACWLGRSEPEPCLELAETHQLRGDFLAAGRVLDSALATVPTGSTTHARRLDLLGVNELNSARPTRALELHESSLRWARWNRDRGLEARALINRARVLYHTQGALSEAEESLQLALQIGEELGDRVLVADALRNLGVVYWFGGETARPLEQYYLPALELYRELGHRRGIAVTLSNIGHIHYHRGDLSAFLRYQSKSVEIKSDLGDLAGLTDSYSYLGDLYSELGNHRRAYDYLSRAVELSTCCGYWLGANEAEARLANVSGKLGRLDEAIAIGERLLERDSQSPYLAKFRFSKLGHLYLRKGEPAIARRLFRQALALDRELERPDLQAGLLKDIAWTFIAEGALEDAAALLARVKRHGTEDRRWFAQFTWQLTAAELEQMSGNADAALEHLMRALEIESASYGKIDSELALGQGREIYDRLLTLLFPAPDLHAANRPVGLDPAAAARAAFRILEHSRHRSLSNRLAALGPQPSRVKSESAADRELSEIEQLSLDPEWDPEALHRRRKAYHDYEQRVVGSRPERGTRSAKRGLPVTFEELQPALGRDTALVEYFFAGPRAVALLITSSQLRVVSLPASPRELARKVKLLRALLVDTAGHDWEPVAKELRSLLIRPIEDTGALEEIKTLGLVPFAFLHHLPFAALARHDEEETALRFLIEDYDLFFTPSATFFKQATETRRDHAGALALGHNGGSAERGGPLRFAEAEARGVARVLGGEARVGVAATETALKRMNGRPAVLHLAAHAVSQPLMPLLSHIDLAASNSDDGGLTVREILELGLQADLVTLSACRTGESHSMSSNRFADIDRLGLIEAFLFGGANSVLASVLPVDDRSTLELMESFYGHLPKTGRARALASAQREMIERGAEPRAWAPFVLVGSDRRGRKPSG